MIMLNNSLNTDDNIFTSQNNIKVVLFIDLIISIIFLIFLFLFFTSYLLIISFWIGAIIGSLALLLPRSIKVHFKEKEIIIVQKILLSRNKKEDYIKYDDIRMITLSTQFLDTFLIYPTLRISTKNGKYYYITTELKEWKFKDVFNMAEFLETKSKLHDYHFQIIFPSSWNVIHKLQQKFWTKDEIIQVNQWKERVSTSGKY